MAIRDLDNIDLLAQEAREADNTGTIASEDRFDSYRKLQREKDDRRRELAAGRGLFQTNS